MAEVAGGGGVLVGCLLWALIPGPIARERRESWHMPKKVATRVLGERSIWEAGVRLLRVGSPEVWRAISDIAKKLESGGFKWPGIQAVSWA